MSRDLDRHRLEAMTVRWLARLPVLRADDMPLLTGAHEADARRALELLVRLGWIERVRTRSPEIDEDCVHYLLRAVAVPRLLEVLQLDPEEARRDWPLGHSENLARVSRVEICDFVNGLLASLVANLRGTTTEVGDARALPDSRREPNSWRPQHIEAYGHLRHDDRYAHFFVAWDRRRAPLVHRRARVRAWYDAAEDRNHWGEGRLPPVLLVCDSRELEQWEEAVVVTARRRDVYELDVLVTAPEHSFDNVIGATWTRLGEREAMPLGRLLHWSHVPPPYPDPQPVRYDLLARGVEVPTPTLHGWARSLLQGGAGRPSERVAALSLELEEQHKDVLELLGRHPYLSTAEVADRSGVRTELSERLVRGLARHGLVASAHDPGHPGTKRYFCTHEALRFLAAREGVPQLRFGEHGVIATETSARGRGGGRLRNLRRNLEHTVGVNVFFARLTRDARRAGHPRPSWWSEAEATQHFSHRDRTYWIRPDGAGAYYLGERRVPFLLEYDRGTMRRRDYLRKLAGIAAYFDSEGYESAYGRRPVVLVVGEDDRSEERFALAVCAAVDQFGIDLPMLFTARWRFERDPRNPNGTLGPIWRRYDSPSREPWLQFAQADET